MSIGFVSLGCPKNLVDSEVMIGLAEHGGYRLTPDPRHADVLVVNTCAFIDDAKTESIDAILEMAEHKRTGRCSRLVVTGCLAERYRDELRAEIPEIDIVLGTGEVPEIVRALNQGSGVSRLPLYRGDRAVVEGEEIRPRWSGAHRPVYLYDADTPRTLTTPSHLAYLKIAEGCDYACAFCIIPTLRGSYRSRPISSIVTEARSLVARGVRELALISQDTTFYGQDRDDRQALPELLRTLDGLPDLTWIRLMYLYPTTIREETIDAIAGCGSVCRYIDVPLQHAADSVLRRMKRPGTRASYERLIDRLRSRIPGVALRTTFIVGFPGETDAEFRELTEFVESVGFDHVGVFTYSHEEGTSAHRLCDDVPAALKRERQRALMVQQRQLVARALARRVGQVERVLVDGPSPEHPLVLQGRHEGQAYEIDSVVYLTDCEVTAHEPGAVIPAQIVAARGYDLVARPLPGDNPA